MFFSYLFVLKKGGNSNYSDSKEYVVDTAKKDSYLFSMSYVMDEGWINSNVDYNTIDMLQKNNYVPYQGVIQSNVIKYISKK